METFGKETPNNQEEGDKKYFKEKIGNIEVYFSNRQEINKSLLDNINKIKKDENYLNYSKAGQKLELSKMGISSGGPNTYVFSKIDDKDKYSDNYFDCTGLLVTGIQRGTNKKISFITHQDPEFFVKNSENKKSFKKELDNKLDDFINKCEIDSIDTVIFGGNIIASEKGDIFDENFVAGRDDVEDVERYFPNKYANYRDSVKLLDFIVFNKIEKHPIVALGPNDNWDSPDNTYGESKHSLSTYFDNENNKLYLVGPTRTHPESFSAKDIYEKIEELENDKQ